VAVLVLMEDDKKAMILTYMARIGPIAKKNKKINMLKILRFFKLDF
jgi:hypothetical protein